MLGYPCLLYLFTPVARSDCDRGLLACKSHANLMQSACRLVGVEKKSDDSIRYNVPAGHTRWRRGRCRLAATAGQSGPREAQKVGGPGLPWIALDRPGSPRSALETHCTLGTRVSVGGARNGR